MRVFFYRALLGGVLLLAVLLPAVGASVEYAPREHQTAALVLPRLTETTGVVTSELPTEHLRPLVARRDAVKPPRDPLVASRRGSCRAPARMGTCHDSFHGGSEPSASR